MPKNIDSNQSAVAAIERLIGEPLVENKEFPSEAPKNPAAVALGRLGGKKGGPARAAKLSKKERSDIAKKAAKARWAAKNEEALNLLKAPGVSRNEIEKLLGAKISMQRKIQMEKNLSKTKEK